MKKRLVSFVLALVVVLSLWPTAAMAETTTPAMTFSATYQKTGDVLMASASNLVSGDAYQSDWKAFGLARAGKTLPQSYIDSAKANLSGNPAPILALAAAGEEPSEEQIAKMVTDYDYTGSITFASNELLALDACGYETPLRATLTNYMLSEQNISGAWGYYWNGFIEDIDSTCMVVQALAPYYGVNSSVTSAIDRALGYIKLNQNPNGTYGAWGPSVETTAQVIVALTALGLDPAAYCGKSCIDGLLTLSNVDGGFISAYDANITNAQGYYALVAYHRYLTGMNALYDMSPEKPSHGSHGALPNVAEVKSATTGDIGIAVYITLGTMSCVGSVARLRKRDKV